MCKVQLRPPPLGSGPSANPVGGFEGLRFWGSGGLSPHRLSEHLLGWLLGRPSLGWGRLGQTVVKIKQKPGTMLTAKAATGGP